MTTYIELTTAALSTIIDLGLSVRIKPCLGVYVLFFCQYMFTPYVYCCNKIRLEYK